MSRTGGGEVTITAPDATCRSAGDIQDPPRTPPAMNCTKAPTSPTRKGSSTPVLRATRAEQSTSTKAMRSTRAPYKLLFAPAWTIG